MKSRSRAVLLYAIGAVVFLSFPILFSPDFTRPYLFEIPPFQRDFITYVLLLIFFFFCHFFLIPGFYLRKKYAMLTLILLISYAVIIYVPWLIIPRNMPNRMREGGFRRPPHHFEPSILREIGHHFFQFAIVFMIALLLRISMRWKRAEKQRLNAELSYLKAQVNPHFLFNTLNSIYSLAVVKSDETADAVVKLSGMMRYVTSETSQDFVALEKEINYIRNYIDLQKIRIGNTARVNCVIDGVTEGKQIAPLILIPFIENAFKFGVNPEADSEIRISINITDSELTMNVVNNKVNMNATVEDGSGVGIENAKQRLDLLYAGDYTLRIRDEADEFEVDLTVNLLTDEES